MPWFSVRPKSLIHEPPLKYGQSTIDRTCWLTVFVSYQLMYPEGGNFLRRWRHVFLVSRHVLFHCPFPLLFPSPDRRTKHHTLLHDAGIPFTGQNTSNTDSEMWYGSHCADDAKSVYQWPKHCATTPRSEYRISLDFLPAQIEGPKGCLKTYALLDTG